MFLINLENKRVKWFHILGQWYIYIYLEEFSYQLKYYEKWWERQSTEWCNSPLYKLIALSFVCTAVLIRKEPDRATVVSMAAFQSFVVCLIVAFAVVVSPTCADLCPDFYAKVCPDALPTIRSVVQNAINHEPRIGASLLRLHFHDCFVNVSFIWVFSKRVS
jgi:hypothetical protein